MELEQQLNIYILIHRQVVGGVQRRGGETYYHTFRGLLKPQTHYY